MTKMVALLPEVRPNQALATILLAVVSDEFDYFE